MCQEIHQIYTLHAIIIMCSASCWCSVYSQTTILKVVCVIALARLKVWHRVPPAVTILPTIFTRPTEPLTVAVIEQCSSTYDIFAYPYSLTQKHNNVVIHSCSLWRSNSAKICNGVFVLIRTSEWIRSNCCLCKRLWVNQGERKDYSAMFKPTMAQCFNKWWWIREIETNLECFMLPIST